MDHDPDLLARLRLIRTRSVGPITFHQLVGRFGGAAAALDALPDLARRGGGEPPRVPSLREAQAEADRVLQLGGQFLLIGRPGYPPLLAELESAPPLLMVRGLPELLARGTVAIVGARNASAAAIRFARQLAHDLAGEGLVVVSGLARGIDTAAHAGALAGGTVGVIAGGRVSLA